MPWLISFRPTRRSLLGELQMTKAPFKASDAAPSVLSFRAGQVERVKHGWQIAPVAKLDLELFDAKGERLACSAASATSCPATIVRSHRP